MLEVIKVGIRVRLLALVTGVAIPLSLLGLAGLWEAWTKDRQHLDVSLKKEAELAAVAFEQWAYAQRQPLDTIAADVAARSANHPLVTEHLELVVSTHPYWLDLRILNAAGKVVGQVPAASPPTTPQFAEKVLSETLTRPWLLETDWSRNASQSSIIVAVQVKGGGAVVGRINIAAVTYLFARDVELSENASLLLFGPDGRILYRAPRGEEYIGLDASKSPLTGALVDQRAAVLEVESPADGIRRAYGLAQAGDTDCIVAIGLPSKTLYEPARRQMVRYSALSALAILLAVGAALIIAGRISGPMRRLNSAARRFGGGDLSARISISGGGELAELGAAFNTMAAQTEERQTRLTELDRLKSDFVSGVSHELRTPLTTIKTLTRLLLRDGLTESERREYLETVATECDREIDLVLNLLDLSRVEAGALNLNPAPTDVIDAVRACLVIEHHAAAARGHSLVAEVPPDTPPVLADRAALRRVLCGLVENAIKYTPEGGRIVVAASNADRVVALSIRDTGLGIASEDVPHIFDKFYRGRAIQSAPAVASTGECIGQAPGIGLGLYLARILVEQLGGHIEVDTAPGLGSTFTVFLPEWREDGGAQNEHAKIQAAARR
jgi:signal transduction histidine kinase